MNIYFIIVRLRASVSTSLPQSSYYIPQRDSSLPIGRIYVFRRHRCGILRLLVTVVDVDDVTFHQRHRMMTSGVVLSREFIMSLQLDERYSFCFIILRPCQHDDGYIDDRCWLATSYAVFLVVILIYLLESISDWTLSINGFKKVGRCSLYRLQTRIR